MKQVVVLVHGIWMTGVEMSLLRRRIRRCGFETRQFRYPSLRATPAENARRLNLFLRQIDADFIHFVAHSLGGIVVSQLFYLFPEQRPGRIIMLGSPLKGSATAAAYHRFVPTRVVLGKSVVEGLLGGVPVWQAARPLAMIAGNHGFGIGKMAFGALPDPSDGTVAVSETEAEGVTEHLTLPFSHFGMLFARPVADAVCQYLQQGEFERTAP